MKLIFLDVDGVLNGHEFQPGAQSNLIRPDCVARLNRILDATGAKLVISSAWRYMIHGGEMTPLGFEYMLRTHGLPAGCVVGFTAKDEAILLRGDQIRGWIDRNGYDYDSWLVIDDLTVGMERVSHRQIVTDGTKGLQDDDVERAIEMLSEVQP